jgi:hypothetical protein
MMTLRTTTNLTKHDARRLMAGGIENGGFEIAYVETDRSGPTEKTTIVWTRPLRPAEIPLDQLPY